MTTSITISLALSMSLAVGDLCGLFSCFRKDRSSKTQISHREPLHKSHHSKPLNKRALFETIQTLQSHPSWKARDNAAHRLGEVSGWHDCPEIVPALCFALLHDPHEEVREEAAESLFKLRPSDPLVHRALTEAAWRDPDHATRKWARKALERIVLPIPSEFRGTNVVIPPRVPGLDRPIAPPRGSQPPILDPRLPLDPPILYDPQSELPDPIPPPPAPPTRRGPSLGSEFPEQNLPRNPESSELPLRVSPPVDPDPAIPSASSSTLGSNWPRRRVIPTFPGRIRLVGGRQRN